MINFPPPQKPLGMCPHKPCSHFIYFRSANCPYCGNPIKWSKQEKIKAKMIIEVRK